MKAKSLWMSAFAASIAMGALLTGADAQEKRTWTAKSGHKVEATLVKYSDFEITLKLPNGQEKAIALDQFEKEDLDYLKKFPQLMKKEKPKKFPFIRLSAKVGSRARDTVSRDHSASKQYEIEVLSREKAAKEVTVRYCFVAKPTGRGTKTPDKMRYIDKREQKLTIPAQASMKIDTIRGTGRGHRGFELSGVIVQLFWKGYLIDSYTDLGALSSVAKDETLWKRATNY